jgi:2-methylcitrate dehydratase PrpD
MPQHVADEALGDPEVQRLSAVLSMDEDNYANRLFPLQRMARAEITLHAGDILKSGWFEPKWDAAAPPTQGELEEKFHAYAGPVLGQARSDALHLAVMSLDKTEAQPLFDLLSQPIS